MEAAGQQTAAEEMQAWNVLTPRLGDHQDFMKSMCIFTGHPDWESKDNWKTLVFQRGGTG